MTAFNTNGFFRMPIEVIGLISNHLDPEDVFHLSLTTPHFQYIIRDQGICRHALQVGVLPALWSHSLIMYLD